MKSLKESINEVMNSSKAISTKRKELMAFGLMSSDASHIIYMYNMAHPNEVRERRPRIKPFEFKFGVELECLCNRYNVERTLVNDEVPYNWVGSYYHSNGNSVFEFKRDGSIYSDENTTSGNHGIEMVSPVLDKNGFDVLKKACDALENNGAQVNKTTGFHVHVSSKGMTDKQYVNVFKNYAMLERVIDTFMANSRRGNNAFYAKSIRNFTFDYCNNPNDVNNLFDCRYFKVNPRSWAQHKTIEFRQHQGTTNYTKVKNWVDFCVALVGWSRDHVLDSEVASIDEIPFLNAAQKTFFKKRAQKLSGVVAA